MNIYPGKRITVEFLWKIDACASHIRLFKKNFPTGVRLSKHALLKAEEKGLNTNWFFERTLNMASYVEYHSMTQKAFEAWWELPYDSDDEAYVALTKQRIDAYFELIRDKNNIEQF